MTGSVPPGGCFHLGHAPDTRLRGAVPFVKSPSGSRWRNLLTGQKIESGDPKQKRPELFPSSGTGGAAGFVELVRPDTLRQTPGGRIRLGRNPTPPAGSVAGGNETFARQCAAVVDSRPFPSAPCFPAPHGPSANARPGVKARQFVTRPFADDDGRRFTRPSGSPDTGTARRLNSRVSAALSKDGVPRAVES